MHEVRVPADAWEGDAECSVSMWFYPQGQAVAQGVLLAELMLDKATIEVHAPAAGRLKIVVPLEGVAKKGDLLATLE